MPKPYFDLQKAGETAEIYIFGDITTFPMEESDVSAYRLANQLAQLGSDVAEINVHIDSYGGNVSEGWAIYNALRASRAQVTTHADGFVASAAIYPFLAGRQRNACSVSVFYFHPVSAGVYGYAEDLQNAAREAQTMTDIGLQAFVDGAGMDLEQARALVNSKAWYTPAQMLDSGIATAIVGSAPGGAQQSVRREIIRRLLAPIAVPAPPPQEPEAPTAKSSILQLFRSF